MMARYTTRVELHGVDDSETYESLHEEMESRGFKRYIENSDNLKYQLPPAEYNYEGNTDKSAVLKKAKLAAAAVKIEYDLPDDASILVTGPDGRTWANLDIFEE